jgi:hypothetical protein
MQPEAIAEIEQLTGLKFIGTGASDVESSFGPEDLLAYVYSILYTPSFRERYADQLAGDFPRIPITTDASLFRRLVVLGRRLIDLHLFEAQDDAYSLGRELRFPVPGTGEVAAPGPRFIPIAYSGSDKTPSGRVYINGAKEGGQYFEAVPAEVWEFQLGGYQVCEKWLKDRRGKILSYEHQEHWKRIVGCINATIGVMRELDTTIRTWPI